MDSYRKPQSEGRAILMAMAVALLVLALVNSSPLTGIAGFLLAFLAVRMRVRSYSRDRFGTGNLLYEAQELVFSRRPRTPGEFTVKLVSAGPKYIRLIKALRDIFDLGLREAKDAIDMAPLTLKSGISQEDASYIKDRLEEAGAVVIVTKAADSKPAADATEPSPQLPTSPSGGCDLALVAIRSSKDRIPLRKVLKGTLGLDLVEAYSAVEQPPAVLKHGITRREAEALKQQLESLGAIIEIR